MLQKINIDQKIYFLNNSYHSKYYDPKQSKHLFCRRVSKIYKNHSKQRLVLQINTQRNIGSGS